MNKKLMIAIIAIVVGGVAAFFYFSSITGNSVAASDQSAASQAVQHVKLADTQYANYAYLISTDNYSPETQLALSGFKVEKAMLPDGSQQINLQTTNQGYVNQTYIVKPGQQLYFIDTSIGEDNGLYDGTLSDDMAAIVDSNGYIVDQ